MARAAIRDLPSGVSCYKDFNGRGETSWRIRLGSRFTGGAPLKKSFHTAREARDWFHGDGQVHRGHRETPLALKAKGGAAGFELSSRQIADAAAAIRLLGSAGTLNEAAMYFLQKAKPPEGEREVTAVIGALLESKQKAERSPRHLKGLRINLNRLAKTFGKSKIHEIRSSQIENWLNDEGFVSTTRKNYLRDLNIMFRFALSRGWSVTNPLLRIERPDPLTEEYQILGPHDVAEFLAVAEESLPEIAVALAIKFFAGLRTSELFKLDWSDINARRIVVKGQHAKTRQRRIVTVADNLEKWIARYPGKGGITSRHDNAWHRDLQTLGESVTARRQLADKSAPVFSLPPNAARHCFCSYHYELYRNENLTAAEAGNTPAVIFRNYRSLVTPVDAVAYWQIVPQLRI